MRISFVSAILASVGLARPQWIPPDRVNVIRDNEEDGDYRMASCEFHHSLNLDTNLKTITERNVSGTIYVEQIYSEAGGGW